MTPEVQSALNSLIVAIIAIATMASGGFGLLLKASFERRVKKINEDAEALRKEREQKLEDDRKDREQKRNIEMEEMRQKTATAQAAAEQAQAVGENLINLNATMIQLINTHTAEQHANRGVLTNQAQSIGDMSDSLEKVALAVVDNTSVSRATGQKADVVVEAINHLEKILNSGIQEIKLMLTPPPPPTNVVNVNTAPADKPDDGLQKAG